MAGPESARLPRGTSAWAKLLLTQQLPALAKAAQAIADCAADESSSGTELAALILRDAGMTTKVLRLASSRLHNPLGLRIRTVSRAVALLGFDVVREIALGIAVLEVLVGRHPGCAQAASEAVRALRSAVLARGLAERVGVGEPEEIFIAALLQDIGHLAFWSTVPQLLPEWGKDAAEAPDQAAKRAHREFDLDLDALSTLLNTELRLSPLLLGDGDRTGLVVVRLARRWVDALAPTGKAGDFEAALEDAGRRFPLTTEALRDLVATQARQSDALVDVLFDPAVRAMLPASRSAAPPGRERAAKTSRTDALLGLEVLRELAELAIGGKHDPGIPIAMVMEGLRRAAGMDRVLFALLSSDRSELRLRSLLEVRETRLTDAFPLPLAECGRLLELMAQPRPVRLGEGGPETGRLLARLGTRSALVAPLVVEGRPIGLLYADRADTGEAIEAEAQTLFGLLAQQANLALATAR